MTSCGGETATTTKAGEPETGVPPTESAPDFSAGFDAAAYLEGAGLTLESAAAAGAAQRALETLSSQLSVEIDRRVADHYADLLGQASALRETAAAVRAIAAQAAALQAALARVRAGLLAPCARVRARTEQLQQLHDSAEVVRSVLAYAQHLQQLRAASDAGDTARAADALRALTALRASPAAAPRLAAVRAVADSRAYVDASAARLRAAAAASLRAGLAQLNQAEIAAALRALHALAALDPGTATALSEIVDSSSEAIHSILFDPQPFQPVQTQGQTHGQTGTASSAFASTTSTSATTTGTTATSSNSNSFMTTSNNRGNNGNNNDAWKRVSGALDILGSACGQAWALTKAFTAVRDPASGEALCAHTVAFRESSPLAVLWARLAQRLHGELHGLARTANPTAATLTAAYPRLLRACQDFCARNAAVLAAVPAAEAQLLSAIKPFEADYIDRARADLCATVDRALADLPPVVSGSGASSAAASSSATSALAASTPSSPSSSTSSTTPTTTGESEFAGLARTMVGLLEGARGSGARLVEVVARDVVAAGVTYAERQLRARVRGGADCVQVRDRMTAAQQANAAVFQRAAAAHAALAPLPAAVLWLPAGPAQTLRDACARVEAAAAACIAPLFQSAAKSLEGALYLMHTEDFSTGGGNGQEQQKQQPVESSPYMVSFEKALRHFHTQFVARLVPCAVLRTHVARLCERLRAFFVRNAALVHPLGATGRARLAHDAAQLEAALTRLQPLSPDAEATPTTAKDDGTSGPSAPTGREQLRALQDLLARDPEVLEQGEKEEEGALPPECRVLPASATLHHLYGRLQDAARAAPPPWQPLRLGSLAAYNDWLDRHGDADVWACALRPALERFAAALNASDAPQYPALYRRIFAVADTLLAPPPSDHPESDTQQQ